jgi:hypothetical protein
MTGRARSSAATKTVGIFRPVGVPDCSERFIPSEMLKPQDFLQGNFLAKSIGWRFDGISVGIFGVCEKILQSPQSLKY